MTEKRKRNEYQIGDMVFCQNSLAIITDSFNTGNTTIYSVESGVLVNGHSDMEPDTHIYPVPITLPTLTLLGKVECKSQPSWHCVNRDNVWAEGLHGSCVIDLNEDKYLTVDVDDVRHPMIHTCLWKKNTEEGDVNREKDIFICLNDEYSYIHEIQQLIRALKFDLNVVLK